MTTPNTPRLIREAWITTLNAFPAVQALDLTFEDSPSVIDPDIPHDVSRGFVALGDERDVNGQVAEAQIVTSVVAAARTDKEALDLVDAARSAILDAFRSTETDKGYLGGVVGAARYAGSEPAVDSQGRRIVHARHYFIAVRFINPLPAL